MSWLDNIPAYTGRGSQLSEQHGWKGTEAGKHARHRRVHIRRGRAKDYPCVRCSEYGVGRRALEWAQVHGTDGDDPWADYLPLCRRCHFRYDGIKLGGDTSMYKKTGRRVSRAVIVLSLLVATLTITPVLTAAPASAAPRVTTSTLGDRVLNEAMTRAGHWYSYGSAGPTYFDCSGLVYWSARQLGISLPRTTFGMLAGSAHLYRIPLSWARRGDLLFYGSGHVEIDTAWWHTTFGAQQTGTRVGWHPWSGWWAPTMAMRFR